MRKNDKRFLIIVAILFAIGGALSVVKYYKIREDGVFVIAEIESISFGKSGHSAHISYKFKGKEYKSSFMPSYDFKKKQGQKFFIKILPGTPTQYEYYDIDVPDCILNEPVESGWEKIPNCK